MPHLAPLRNRFSAWHLAVLCSGLALFGFYWLAPVSYAGSDARFSLYVSQAILDSGTVRLDGLTPHLPVGLEADYRLERLGDHLYYAFPWGTSFFSLPIVYIANLAGHYPLTPTAENELQAIIAALVSAVIFVVLVGMARCHLSRGRSLGVAWLMMLATPLSSTLGTALWGLNFTVLFLSLSLWLLMRQAAGKVDRAFPVLLGFFLFSAFFSRPTAAIFIVLVFLYLGLTKRWNIGWQTAVATFIPFALFSLYTQYEMGQWLPTYYQPTRLDGNRSSYWLVLYGLLFSPGRGLFVFAPICLAILGWAWRHVRQVEQRPLLYLATSWIILHLLVVMRFPHWWGGHSFGPRLLTDIMPAFYGLLIIAVQQIAAAPPGRMWRAILAVVVAVSLFVNSYAALFNPFTRNWNGGMMMPQIDQAPSYLFDWRYPQFLANREMLCARNLDFSQQMQTRDVFVMAPYELNRPLTAVMSDGSASLRWPLPHRPSAREFPQPSELAYHHFLPLIHNGQPLASWWTGWYNALGRPTTSAFCPTASIEIGAISSIIGEVYHLELVARGERPLPITVSLNDTPIAELRLSTELTHYAVAINPQLLRSTAQNKISFDGDLADNLTLQSIQITHAGD